MEMAVLIGVFGAAGLLVASGIWVGLALIGAITRIKRPAVDAKRETPEIRSRVARDPSHESRAITPRPDSAQP